MAQDLARASQVDDCTKSLGERCTQAGRDRKSIHIEIGFVLKDHSTKMKLHQCIIKVKLAREDLLRHPNYRPKLDHHDSPSHSFETRDHFDQQNTCRSLQDMDKIRQLFRTKGSIICSNPRTQMRGMKLQLASRNEAIQTIWRASPKSLQA